MLPLKGLIVIAVEQYGAGPFGSMLLADMGAEVIKIENPAEGGDVSRTVGPYFFEKGGSHHFQAFNRNKRSITLNLKHPEGQSIFHALVREADAVCNNLRGDQPVKLGLTYEALKNINPKIVCGHISAYGRTGPRKTWPGYDYLMQAEAGYLSVTGEPNGPPARMGLSMVDYMTGVMAAFGLVSALHGARTTGKGMDIDTSLFDTALHNLTYLAAWYLNEGHVQQREPRSAHPSVTPSQLYRCKDGWIFIMCNKEKFWRSLCERVGHPEWPVDPQFADPKTRFKNRETLTALLDEALASRTAPEWISTFDGEVPAAPVYDVAQALENPYVKQMGGIVDYTDPQGSDEIVKLLASPLKIGGETLPTQSGPAMGADTGEVLARIGVDAERLAALRKAGVI